MQRMGEGGRGIPPCGSFQVVQDKIAARRRFVALAGLGILALPLSLRAQPKPQPQRVWRVGYLSGAVRPPDLEASAYGGFLLGMRESGYFEGKHFVMEWRFANGDYEQLRKLAAELARGPVDVIVAATPAAILEAMRATAEIPIVMVTAFDPVATGLVASLAKPGGNVTGLAANPEIHERHLNLLLGLFPMLSGLGILLNPGNPSHAAESKALGALSAKSHLSPLMVDARTPAEIEQGIARMARDRVGAFILLTDALFFAQRQQIAEFAIKARLPWIVSQSEYVESGGLISFGYPLIRYQRRAAAYVGRILKGARPQDLPVEQLDRLDLVFNLKTAAAMGVKIPPYWLALADRVIN